MIICYYDKGEIMREFVIKSKTKRGMYLSKWLSDSMGGHWGDVPQQFTQSEIDNIMKHLREDKIEIVNIKKIKERDKMIEKIIKWQNEMKNNYRVDITHYSKTKELRAYKLIPIKDNYFIEIAFVYDTLKVFKSIISVVKRISETDNKGWFIKEHIRTLEENVISKDNRVNTKKIFALTEDVSFITKAENYRIFVKNMWKN